jgi:hypothetical protein
MALKLFFLFLLVFEYGHVNLFNIYLYFHSLKFRNISGFGFIAFSFNFNVIISVCSKYSKFYAVYEFSIKQLGFPYDDVEF